MKKKKEIPKKLYIMYLVVWLILLTVHHVQWALSPHPRVPPHWVPLTTDGKYSGKKENASKMFQNTQLGVATHWQLFT